ncbi:MAG: DNA polymerase III subunit alpha [Flavobacteriaceae bacterium]
MYLIFDTETTGLPRNWNAPLSDSDNWPRCVQIAWQLHALDGRMISHDDFIITPDGFDIPYESEKVHGISTALARRDGVDIKTVVESFLAIVDRADFLVGHNLKFDLNIMGAELLRLGKENILVEKTNLDTCTEDTALLCELPGGRGGKFKLPTLSELYVFLFQDSFEEAHNATADVEATARVFVELIRQNKFNQTELQQSTQAVKKSYPNIVPLAGLKHRNLHKETAALISPQKPEVSGEEIQVDTLPFCHLHTHTQFSVLQSTISIPKLVQEAASMNMSAVAITDIGNLMGAFHFVKAVNKHNKSLEESTGNPIKPIIGITLNVCVNHLDRSHRDDGFQIVLIAKNKNGYHNLAKLTSIAHTKGFYYVPRVDRELILNHKEDIIVLTGNLYGEVPYKVLNTGAQQAEDSLLWWKEHFGSDLYMELMRHNQEDETRVNTTLIELANKHGIKMIASNSCYYLKKEEANAHDILLCIKDGEKQSTPIGRGRGYRYGLPNQEYYFKSPQEMTQLFSDIPEAIYNIQEVIEKIEPYALARDVLLPKFDIPVEFVVSEDQEDGGKRGENAYLRHLTLQGAKSRYGELTKEIQERIDFELSVIENTGYPGYFLIVQDLIAAARSLDVSVGPGRGSAAGSVVAYCLQITNIDPIAYDLLFERFLNPDRVSMPDIDIDFDDEGRSKVMDYVIEKYGANQVAQIVTYGTMAAKSSVRDTARVLDLPLADADRLAKLIPNVKLNTIFTAETTNLKEDLRADEFQRVEQLKEIANGDDLEAQTLSQAQILEGSLRNTGTHACGVIITPEDISNLVPVATAKDSDLVVTQYDNAVVESAGLLKMDFLGLKTLTLIKDTVKLIKYRHHITLNPDDFPLDDEPTYNLFQRGETVGIFQYESVGMQRYLRELKPNKFEDLIAMNALYRPGPLEYIPSFIRRKNGEEEIQYDLPEMKHHLEQTYGITVYQEQVMLLSQELAGFSKGEADVLRKAMGKKIFSLLEELKPKFINGGKERGHDADILEKIWKDWEAFASYAFNKSHSTCYAWIAYQTAYLKANYPAEYMAAVLSNNMNDIKQVSFFMEECRRMGVPVLGPDVNESFYKFTVNNDNAIRFGMGAIKGVGRGAVDSIVDGRKDKPYQSLFDMTKRVDLRAANKKTFESLVLAGGVDSLGDNHRAQYFQDKGDGVSFLEKALRFGANFQEHQNSSQVSLFGEDSEASLTEPEIPECEPWATLHELKQEKEVVGIYLSGHPLDDFTYSFNHFCNARVGLFNDLAPLVNKELTFGGIIGEVEHRVSKNGKGWAIFQLEDYEDTFSFRIFGEEYLKFRHQLVENNFVHVKAFVRPGWINQETGKVGDPRIQFNDFRQLQDTISTYAKKLTLQININQFEKEKLSLLTKTIKAHKGNHKLDIAFYELNQQIKLVMHSRKKKVNISKELLADLDEQQIHFKLN